MPWRSSPWSLLLIAVAVVIGVGSIFAEQWLVVVAMALTVLGQLLVVRARRNSGAHRR
ncbi:MAG: hypothetical protein AVDCRST_MAG91-3559 [uncultured Sphingomonadaceae bacterium]|uniref:Uncharacterized protein n=1 Tax=uncultured Sphingomonadaceae bacterium TaxID=169976 RepID=A0A6J4U1Q9_9SPHN|nr:MAG: hypothetical protein AVDCRST_MAG91-3559 [uncultured Sphingomonadaceae bacterium]